MTPEAIDALTIAEVRAISERAAEALSRFREVQAMLGGTTAAVATPATQPGLIQTNKGSYVLTPEERARRAALPAFDENGEPTP